MNTAVIISGQMRTFAKCYASQKWMVYRHYEPDICFFVSCKNDEDAESAKLLCRDYENVYIQTYDDPTDLPEIPEVCGFHAPYANAASHKKLMLQHWGNREAWRLFLGSKLDNFDVFIRMRPDNFFHRFIPKLPCLAALEYGNWAFVPWWGKFGGINDRFAVMGKTAAFWYFEVYDEILELIRIGCPFHPESLLAAVLHKNHINVKSNLMAHFSTLRKDGQRWPEVTAEDIAELMTNGQ